MHTQRDTQGEMTDSPSLRETIQFYLIDCQMPLGKIIDITIIFLNILVIAIFITRTYEIGGGLDSLLSVVERAVIAIFINFGDAFYFSVVALTTVGFGDIVPISGAGKAVTVLCILSGIVLIPWQIGKIVREWIHISQKKPVICQKCGLKFHDPDAVHCKACGHLIYQEFDGDR